MFMLFQSDTVEDNPALAQLVEEAHHMRTVLLELVQQGVDIARILHKRVMDETNEALRSRGRVNDGEATTAKRLPDASRAYSRILLAIRRTIATWERIAPISMREITRSPAAAPALA